LRKRLLLLLAAALIIAIILLYPSVGCKVSGDQVKASQVKPFVIPVLEGYAIGFTFNMTNLGNCEVTAESIHIHLRTAIYPDGNVTAVNENYNEPLITSLAAGQTKMLSYAFDSYEPYRPSKLDLKIEVSFGEAGSVTVFDGEMDIPKE
jgi:hypothetical protein